MKAILLFRHCDSWKHPLEFSKAVMVPFLPTPGMEWTEESDLVDVVKFVCWNAIKKQLEICVQPEEYNEDPGPLSHELVHEMHETGWTIVPEGCCGCSECQAVARQYQG